jgi:hypothetical protein
VETWNVGDGKLLSSFGTSLGFVDRADLSARGELVVVFHARTAQSLKIDKVRDNDNVPWREEKRCSPCVSEVWDLNADKMILELGEYRDAIFPLMAISPTLDTIALRDPENDEKQVLLWSTTSQKVFATLRGLQSHVQDIAFSPNGRLVAASSWDKTARLSSTTTGADAAVLRGHADFVNCVAFDQVGAQILTGSRDATARVWLLVEPAVIADLAISALAFSPDGTLLAVAGGQLRTDPNPLFTLIPVGRKNPVRRLWRCLLLRWTLGRRGWEAGCRAFMAEHLVQSGLLQASGCCAQYEQVVAPVSEVENLTPFPTFGRLRHVL